ncbi:MAG: hypothetical protein QOH28_3183 [Actinomycetota bacterium]|nr:hypothetical protein [Actinomycetota bacterium]
MLDELLATVGVQERLVAGSRVGVCALHGGLEQGTAEIAEAAASASGASFYAVVQPDDLRWHVPSHRYDPALSLCLRAFLASIDIVISVHGFGGVRDADDRWTTALLGGTNRELAADLAYALIRALPQYRWIADLDSMPRHLRGLHPANPVNRVALGGVQLELPPRVRRPGPDYDALVSALAGVAGDARHRCSDAG